MLTLIENGEVYAPEPLGRRSVLLVDGRIGKVGDVDRRALDALGIEHEVVDASGCVVTPGIIDPHAHLLGGSGEDGLSTQTPMIFLRELVPYGITTVVGVLGVDTTMKTMAGLLAKAKALKEEGLNAFIWTGGYNVPPTTIMDSAREDLMFIDEVIGVGEVAISDVRAMDPDPRDLARVASDAYNGGKLAKKAGLTHFHVGEGRRRLTPLREVLERFDVEPGWLYPTHVERSEALMREAIELAGVGTPVDIDVVEGDLAKWLRFYLDNHGDPGQLTISTDASISSPRALYEQLCKCVVEHRFPLEGILPFATSNTARILKLEGKGTFEKGNTGDVLVLQRGSLDIVHVLSGGKWMVRDGNLAGREQFLGESDRSINLEGRKER